MVFIKGQIPWNKKEKIQKNCLQCGSIFYVKPSVRKRAKFCSNTCKNKFQ